ncbi:hypothetical protein [Desulfogranum japonicum]|uniref:hypothetical protein n=1 Tax=Desulfogranum japonicum TaxID=231447 RepID=UPI0003F81E97|nr:hypothetical protein [Desulfogranum japonicum]
MYTAGEAFSPAVRLKPYLLEIVTMDAFLDRVWEYLVIGFIFAGETCYAVLQHLHFLGPAVLISVLALCTVLLTKFLNRVIVTKRFLKLEKEYHHWFDLRQEALQCEDPEKGKMLARNIDQAELNRAYYDYFFEGFLLGIARKVIPIFFVFAFLNEFYRQENLQELFGQNYVICLVNPGGEPVLIGAVFWYFISLLACYICWGLGRKLVQKWSRQTPSTMPVPAEDNCM